MCLAVGVRLTNPALRQLRGVRYADAWQAVRSGWDGHVLVVAGVEGGAEAAAGVQSKALTPAQRAMAATKRWVRLTSPLRCVRCAGYCVAGGGWRRHDCLHSAECMQALLSLICHSFLMK